MRTTRRRPSPAHARRRAAREPSERSRRPRRCSPRLRSAPGRALWRGAAGPLLAAVPRHRPGRSARAVPRPSCRERAGRRPRASTPREGLHRHSVFEAAAGDRVLLHAAAPTLVLTLNRNDGFGPVMDAGRLSCGTTASIKA
jgi:hypothetical protein